MKGIVVAVLAAVGLGGCVAVPAYYPDAGYGGGYGYYGAPAYPSVSLGVGINSGPRYYGGHRHRGRW
ncbi:MAG TPA: hypothetical protein VM029_17200 [Opitutaceae bacterium]|nr:hypothetical protein [Opitutaceae bacterium]